MSSPSEQGDLSSSYSSDGDLSSSYSSDGDLSSSYSSDGEVACAYTKLLTSKPVQDFQEINDDPSFLSKLSPEDKVILERFPRLKYENCLLLPRAVRFQINKVIHKQLNAIGKRKLAFIKSPSLCLGKEPVSTPRNVLCDAFIFGVNQPVIVLTFVTNTSDQVINYNSTLARCLNTEVRQQMRTEFYPVHGVVERYVWESLDSFAKTVSAFEDKAVKIAVPLSITLSQESLGTVLRIFNRLGQDLEPGQSDPFKQFVETAAYREARETLNTNRILVITGGPGEGKTLIGKRLCFDYQQQGYNTVFYQTQQEIDWRVLEETVSTLVVCDNIGDFVDPSWLQIDSKTTRLVLILKKYDLSVMHWYIASHIGIVDITKIRIRNNDSKKEFFEMLRLSLIDMAVETLQETIQMLPSYVGFPKALKQYRLANITVQPTEYFKHPLPFFKVEIENLASESDMGEFVYIILCGGNADENDVYKSAFEVLQLKFPGIEKAYVLKRMRCFIGSFLDEAFDTVQFSHPVIYDACLSVLNEKYTAFFWEHCSVMFRGYEKQQNELQELTIFISEHNTDVSLSKLAYDLKQGKLKDTLSNEVLTPKENTDKFLREVSDSLRDIVHVSESSETFLYWVLHSNNEYLKEQVLAKKEITQEQINESLMRCVTPEETDTFLSLRLMLRKIQRIGILYSVGLRDREGKTLLMRAKEAQNKILVEVLKEDERAEENFHRLWPDLGKIIRFPNLLG